MILQDYASPYDRVSMRFIKRLKFNLWSMQFTLKRHWLRWKLFTGIYYETRRFQIIYTLVCTLAFSGIVATMYAIYHLTH